MNLILKSQFGDLSCNIVTSKYVIISLPGMQPCTMGKHTFSFTMRLQKKEDEWQVESAIWFPVKSLDIVPKSFQQKVVNAIIQLLIDKVDSNPILQMDVELENINRKISEEENRILLIAEQIKEDEIEIANIKALLPKLELKRKQIRRKYLTKQA